MRGFPSGREPSLVMRSAGPQSGPGQSHEPTRGCTRASAGAHGIEPEVVVAAELLEVFPGGTVPVAQMGHLIALKLLARDDRTRPQDAADLRALRDVAPEAEIARARLAVSLIHQRGYARGRDLAAALLEWLAPPSG